MVLSEYGQIVEDEWLRTPSIRSEVGLDTFVVMPNHVHGIVVIKEDERPDASVGAHGRAPLRAAFIAGFKSAVARRINALRGTPGAPVWQRNYYEHIVRDDAEINRIREYILNNPMNWALGENNPIRIASGKSSVVAGPRAYGK